MLWIRVQNWHLCLVRNFTFCIILIANSTSHSWDHFWGFLIFSSLSHVHPQASAIVYISDTSKILLSLMTLNASSTSSGNQSSSASSWVYIKSFKLLVIKVRTQLPIIAQGVYVERNIIHHNENKTQTRYQFDLQNVIIKHD